MALKGQKLKTYSEELKAEAIRLHVEDKWTYRQINEHLDQRGRRLEYINQDRYVQKLKRENEISKKCLEIWMLEVRLRSIEP